jgi:hypothetical protein
MVLRFYTKIRWTITLGTSGKGPGKQTVHSIIQEAKKNRDRGPMSPFKDTSLII